MKTGKNFVAYLLIVAMVMTSFSWPVAAGTPSEESVATVDTEAQMLPETDATQPGLWELPAALRVLALPGIALEKRLGLLAIDRNAATDPSQEEAQLIDTAGEGTEPEALRSQASGAETGTQAEAGENAAGARQQAEAAGTAGAIGAAAIAGAENATGAAIDLEEPSQGTIETEAPDPASTVPESTLPETLALPTEPMNQLAALDSTPGVSFSTINGLWARWGDGPKEWFLKPDENALTYTTDKIILSGSNLLEGYKLYYRWDSDWENPFDISTLTGGTSVLSGDTGWTCYTGGSAGMPMDGNGGSLIAAVADETDVYVADSAVSTYFWGIGAVGFQTYAEAGNYSIQPMDYFNLSFAADKNFAVRYYMSVDVGASPTAPTIVTHDAALQDGESYDYSDLLSEQTGTVNIYYKAIAEYFYTANDTVFYTTAVAEPQNPLSINISPTLSVSTDTIGALSYPFSYCLYPSVYTINKQFADDYTIYWTVDSNTNYEDPVVNDWNEYNGSFTINAATVGENTYFKYILYKAADSSYAVFNSIQILPLGFVIAEGTDANTVTTGGNVTLRLSNMPYQYLGWTNTTYYKINDGAFQIYTGPIAAADLPDGSFTLHAYVTSTKGTTTYTGDTHTYSFTKANPAPTVTVSEANLLTIAGYTGTAYYTLDGSDPTSSVTRTEYSGPFYLNGRANLVKTAATTDGGAYTAVGVRYIQGGVVELGALTEAGLAAGVFALAGYGTAGNTDEVTQTFTLTTSKPGQIGFVPPAVLDTYGSYSATALNWTVTGSGGKVYRTYWTGRPCPDLRG